MNARLSTPLYEETFGTACGLDAQSRSRRGFLERLERSVADARCGGHRVGIFLVGIDRPSGVLGSLEPGAAGSLVERVAERLGRCTGDDERAARLRDDEFAILMPRLRNGSQAREAASRMLGMLRFPFQASVGIAMFPTDGAQAAALIGCAAAALAHARRAGRHSYSFYLPLFAATSAASSSPDL